MEARHMLDVSGTTFSVHYSITARPNCSLPPATCLCVFSIVAFISLSVAIAFTLIGAWPVLPFSGLELAALGWAFHDTYRHASDYERLTIDHSKVVLERHDHKRDDRIELNSCWARVIMDLMPNGSCRRLALRSHGREIEFGHFLSGEERYAIGKQLKSRFASAQAFI